jgi:uncharacterized membrane protein (UPF0182 family)
MTMRITGSRRQAPWQGALRVLLVVIAILVTCLILLELVASFLVDWLWFSAIGYLDIFWIRIVAEAKIFIVVFIATSIILWANGSLALRFTQSQWEQDLTDHESKSAGTATLPETLDFTRRRLPWRVIIPIGASLLATLVAWGEVDNWHVFLRFLYQVPYGANDPVYDKDISFYLFTLMSPAVIAHGSVLLGLFFAVKAWSYYLDRYLLLYGDNGVVVGASYTDVRVGLPALWLLIGLSMIAALAAWANVRVRSFRIPVATAVLVFGGSFVLSGLIPGIFQRVFVRPNELELERPYIQRNIALTQQAYNLQQITVKPFPAEQDLTFKAIEANKATIDNIRLWDWQPLMDAYRQLQEIRTYYKFHDVDVDRYWLGGTYQSVMLSARELKSSLLPHNAQTWVNIHVLFTHGNGVVMSPVTRKSVDGLPLFYLRDIPPGSISGPDIRESRIYYGEETDSYVIVKGSTPEFDYPKGKDNIYASYDGTGGIFIGSFWRKNLFAWHTSVT